VEFASVEFWVAGFQIIVINLLLSGDNAIVIALACRNLPPNQRKWGVIWGALAAVLLRIVLTFFAITLLTLPWLKLVGGVLLVWIGVKLIADDSGGEHEVQASDKLMAAIWTILVADLVMSVDNVLGVAAAARGSLLLLVFGLVLSIPIVIGGSQIIMKLIERFPLLVVAGGGLLGYVAAEMMITDPVVADWVKAQGPWLQWAAPIAGILVVIGPAYWLKRRHSDTASNEVVP
jgi:YjbE family integral membrane protein